MTFNPALFPKSAMRSSQIFSHHTDNFDYLFEEPDCMTGTPLDIAATPVVPQITNNTTGTILQVSVPTAEPELISTPTTGTRLEVVSGYTRETAIAGISRDNNNDLYRCPICMADGKSQTNTRINDVKRHILGTHFMDSPHQCTMCSQSFKQRTHLQTHMRVHENARTPCGIGGCEFSCTDPSSLTRHKRKYHPLELAAEKSRKAQQPRRQRKRAVRLERQNLNLPTEQATVPSLLQPEEEPTSGPSNELITTGTQELLLTCDQISQLVAFNSAHAPAPAGYQQAPAYGPTYLQSLGDTLPLSTVPNLPPAHLDSHPPATGFYDPLLDFGADTSAPLANTTTSPTMSTIDPALLTSHPPGPESQGPVPNHGADEFAILERTEWEAFCDEHGVPLPDHSTWDLPWLNDFVEQ